MKPLLFLLALATAVPVAAQSTAIRPTAQGVISVRNADGTVQQSTRLSVVEGRELLPLLLARDAVLQRWEAVIETGEGAPICGDSPRCVAVEPSDPSPELHEFPTLTVSTETDGASGQMRLVLSGSVTPDADGSASSSSSRVQTCPAAQAPCSESQLETSTFTTTAFAPISFSAGQRVDVRIEIDFE